MDQDKLKKFAAEAAIKLIQDHNIIGVGTGSTVNHFIDLLSKIKGNIEGAVASSIATEQRLKSYNIPIFDLNAVNQVDVYVDGADEANGHLYLIKGKGGAHVREKILATAAKKFICIVDASKKVAVLGSQSPVPIEVIPMARGYVARQIVKLGGNPIYRENFKTDNGNIILDAYNLKILDPIKLEQMLKNITGVVDSGLFAQRRADILLVASEKGIEIINAA